MFDDYLIDGRYLAQVWALNQPSRYANCVSPSDSNSVKAATPIGWVYCKNGYSSEDKVTLRLDEALRTIKKRERGIAIDGIYSVLSLLPYGSKVEPKYKEGKEYKEEELQDALLKVMKTAVENGYGDPLAWHGKGSGKEGICWLPKVEVKSELDHGKIHGSTSVEGGINITCVKDGLEFKLTDSGIEISASVYDIEVVKPSLSKID